MFKKKMLIKVEDSEAINVCNILGKYGIMFRISDIHSIDVDSDPNRKLHYRVFAIRPSARQAKKLFNELNGDPDF